MACSFAVVRIVLIFGLLYKHNCRAEKEFIFKKGNLYQRKFKIESTGLGSGIGWIKAFGSAAKSCDPLKENWFYVKYIYAQNANRVYMTIDYQSSRGCNESGCGLFIRLHKTKTAPLAVNKEDFQDGISGLDANQNRKVTVVHFDMEPDKKFLTFAIQAKGVCTVVYNISVYYYYCPKNNSTSVTLTRTPAPISGSTPVDVRCPQQSRERSMVAYCTSNGTWESFSPQSNLCRCPAGKEFNNKTHDCSPCKKNYFKKSAETNICKPCPKNMVSKRAIKCECTSNFYRISEDEICRKLPSKPLNLRCSILKDNKIRLFWKTPSNFGDQKDLHFKVECQQCKEPRTNCKFCENMSMDEEGIKLSATNLTVSHLQMNTRYEFSVTSLNGVSIDANKKDWQSAMIVVKIPGKNVHTSILPGPPISTIHTTDSTTSVGTTKISTLTTVPSANSQAKQKNNPSGSMSHLTIIAIGIAALAIILLMVGIVIYKRGRMRKRTLDDEGVLLTPFEKSYVDPAKFGNSERAVRTFAKEIDRRQVKLEGLIGEGEFAKVHKGSLCRPNEPPIAVAVKVLKPGSSAKNREDFLTEAAVMGQFKDMNIVALEGVVTMSHPVEIITEFMHNGALSIYLAENKNRLLETQLLGMARGIASGMKYLARMRFVHRDLAARNVLVNENLVCKVADFGLTRELEESCQGEYVTQGGKIPIRWTAPEAYKHRRFTTASDVWSYGIVLWEIMSYAERPYGNWDNYMVMERVNGNYRLTPPTDCPKIVHQLMMECWKADRTQRPAFADIVEMLERWIRNPYLLKDYEYVTEKTRMADRKSCIAKSIREHLESIKMERYVEKFIDYGYTELYQIQQLDDGDLVCIGVPLVGHRNKIMKSLSMRSERGDRSLPTHV